MKYTLEITEMVKNPNKHIPELLLSVPSHVLGRRIIHIERDLSDDQISRLMAILMEDRDER